MVTYFPRQSSCAHAIYNSNPDAARFAGVISAWIQCDVVLSGIPGDGYKTPTTIGRTVGLRVECQFGGRIKISDLLSNSVHVDTSIS